MDYILEISSEKNRFKSETWIKKSYPEFHFFISSIEIGNSWKEKFYLYREKIDVPKCYCGNDVKFISILKGYRKYCCIKCQSNDSVLLNQKKKTCIEKYGVDNPMKSNNIINKLSNSILEKYGVENISKLDSIKDKKSNIMLEKYGVMYNSQREEIRLSLSNKMKSNSNEYNKIISIKNKDNLAFKLEKIGIILLDVKPGSNYFIKCNDKDHVYKIHKNILNDRISKNNDLCTICNPIKKKVKLVFNNNDFLERSSIIHGSKFEYLGEYRNSKSNIRMKCNKCNNVFSQKPYVHLRGSGCPNCSSNVSNKETLWLDYLDIPENFRQKRILLNDKYYNVDAYDDTTNTIYEFYGDYWHGNPTIYNHSDFNKTLNKTFGEIYNKTNQREDILKSNGFNFIKIWESDFNKIKLSEKGEFDSLISFIKRININFTVKGKEIFIENKVIRYNVLGYSLQKNTLLNKYNDYLNKGIHFINVWEDDWTNKRNIVESRLLNTFGMSDKIYARKCLLKEVSYIESKKFLEENHIQGNSISKYNFGLYYNNELVSLMTFCKLRISLGQKHKEGSYELLRFCNKIGYSIIGGASKLISFFIKNYSVKYIVSYADKCWSIGNLYKKLGFNLSSSTLPNYYYVVDGSRSNRFNWRKSNLVKMGYDKEMSESQIMETIGYRKVYDVGSYKFEMII